MALLVKGEQDRRRREEQGQGRQIAVVDPHICTAGCNSISITSHRSTKFLEIADAGRPKDWAAMAAAIDAAGLPMTLWEDFPGGMRAGLETFTTKTSPSRELSTASARFSLPTNTEDNSCSRFPARPSPNP